MKRTLIKRKGNTLKNEGTIDYLERIKYHPAIYMGIDEIPRHSDGTIVTMQELQICEYHYWSQKSNKNAKKRTDEEESDTHLGEE